MSQRQTRTVTRHKQADSDAPPMVVAVGKGRIRDPKISMAEQVAGTQFYIRNWKWSGAVEDFPNEPWLRCVDKFFPKAVGGALAVDEPTMDSDFVACERRQKVLRKRGIRYLILKRSMTLEECQVSLDIEDKKAD